MRTEEFLDEWNKTEHHLAFRPAFEALSHENKNLYYESYIAWHEKQHAN